MSFAGRRVIAFESRRAVEIAELIRRQGGDPFVAPSIRETPVDSGRAASFGASLEAGEFDMAIFLTGVGTRALARQLEGHCDFAGALKRITVVARGPKPAAALRELSVPIAVLVPEPNTWREVLAATAGRPEKHIALQEYGRPATELIAGLEARGCAVTPIQVYQYDLPLDTGPLREGVRRIAAREADVALFTTAIQMIHLARVAGEMGMEGAVLDGLRNAVVASIGPSTTEALEEFGLTPDMVASHPKMGFLIKEAAEYAGSGRGAGGS